MRNVVDTNAINPFVRARMRCVLMRRAMCWRLACAKRKRKRKREKEVEDPMRNHRGLEADARERPEDEH